MSVKTTEENKKIINTKLNKIIGGKGRIGGRYDMRFEILVNLGR